MAVILGNMLENKKEKETIKTNERKRKLETLKNLIGQCEPIVQMATDIWDTYNHIRYTLEEKEFAKKLWSCLCFGKEFDVSSYFCYKLPLDNQKKHCQIAISRFGVSIMYAEGKQVHTANPKFDSSHNDEHTWLGEYLLSDYIEKNEVTTEFLDDSISSLEYMLDNFKNYADKFFDQVSRYNI